MKLKLLFAGAAVAAGTAMPATAETEFKIGVAASAYSGDDVTLPAATVRATAFFNNHFGVEGEASFGIGQDEIDDVELELSSAFAGYVIGRLPVGEQLSFHARLGYGTSTFTGSIQGFGSADVDVDGVSAGIGGEFNLNTNHGLRLDYTRFEADEDGFEGGVDVFSLGYVFTF